LRPLDRFRGDHQVAKQFWKWQWAAIHFWQQARGRRKDMSAIVELLDVAIFSKFFYLLLFFLFFKDKHI
jgi:hypothetical protein